MSEATRAVFLSYSRDDAEAARRIAEALRGFGIETWFDLSELRGGDAWDAKIRRQIRECALFIAVISANTQARAEGYFRREWKLAVERTHDMSESRAFLVPVIVDDNVTEAEADVPEQFLKVHFTRLPGGEPTPQFVEQIKRLLEAPKKSMEAGRPRRPAQRDGGAAPPKKSVMPGWTWGALAAAVVGVAAAFVVFRKPPAAAPPQPVVEPKPAAAAPSGVHEGGPSIAVIPFTNLSEEQGNEYFADGLAEELLNVLSKVRTLRVAARTSAFSFKGKNVDIATIAQKLHVATILEGSVRKAGARVRVSAQLINAADGYQLWSETYDREMADIFAMQSDIARAVVKELRSKLLIGPAAGVDATEIVQKAANQRGSNPEAYRLYLQGQFLWRESGMDSARKSLASFQEAVKLDPAYALGWKGVSDGYRRLAGIGGLLPNDAIPRAREAVLRALALQPDLAEAHAALAELQSTYDWDWKGAAQSIARALELAPDNLDALRGAAAAQQSIGRLNEAAALMRRVIELDPLSPGAHNSYGVVLYYMGNLEDAASELSAAVAIAPRGNSFHLNLSLVLLRRGLAEEALRTAEQEPDEAYRMVGLAVIHSALGQTAASDAALRVLTEKYADDCAYQIAMVRADRKEIDQGFAWLERAYRQRDGGLSWTKANPELRNLHGDPRWLEFLRKLGLADEQLAALK